MIRGLLCLIVITLHAAPAVADTQTRLLSLWTRYLQMCAPMLSDPATPFAAIANDTAADRPAGWSTKDSTFRMYEWVAATFDKTEYIEVMRRPDGLHLTCLVTDDVQPGDTHTELAGAFIALASHSDGLQIAGGEMQAEPAGDARAGEDFGAPYAFVIDGAFGPKPIRTLLMIRSGGLTLQVQQATGAS
ncbi:hypothetical protein [Roseobacter ponti]|uniref:Uncharacterized protein n=1 Tax=Roseobacter ponti TaxID=1891787 RepID=A0A858SZX0_9RHOB|nr:hypothetical protein [Roseobacter ponti]QJF52456.1 hypothetical protein G3256_15400 [Roseobacter ponti]